MPEADAWVRSMSNACCPSQVHQAHQDKAIKHHKMNCVQELHQAMQTRQAGRPPVFIQAKRFHCYHRCVVSKIMDGDLAWLGGILAGCLPAGVRRIWVAVKLIQVQFLTQSLPSLHFQCIVKAARWCDANDFCSIHCRLLQPTSARSFACLSFFSICLHTQTSLAAGNLAYSLRYVTTSEADGCEDAACKGNLHAPLTWQLPFCASAFFDESLSKSPCTEQTLRETRTSIFKNKCADYREPTSAL